MFWPFLGPFPRGLKKHEKHVKHDFYSGGCRIVQAALVDEGGFGFIVGTITLNQGSGFILIIHMVGKCLAGAAVPEGVSHFGAVDKL